MHKFIMNLLECPLCHGELKWEVTKETDQRIQEGRAICISCAADYPIKDEIGIFLTPKLPRNDLWENMDNGIIDYIKKHPRKYRKLMKKPLHKLTPTDQMFKQMVLESLGKFEEALEVEKTSQSVYTKEYRDGSTQQMKYVLSELKDEVVVDLATGAGALVEHIATKTNNTIISTDFSLNILRRNKEVFTLKGFYDNISLLAFDARLTPFKNRSIEVLTSYLGLQNIEESEHLVQELRRIVGGKIMAISHLFNDDDQVHLDLLKQFSMENLFTPKRVLESFKLGGFDVTLKSSHFAKAYPIPAGKIIPYGVDGVPICETTVEWCVIEAK